MTNNLLTYWGISSQLLVEEAEKKGLSVDIISKEKNCFIIAGNNKEIIFKNVDFGGNSALGFKLVMDKELTYKILERNNLPIAKTHYLKKDDFDDFHFSELKDFSFPLIIKPLNEAHGNGVMMHIMNIEELRKKLSLSFQKYDTMIIQEEIQGDEIRVLVFKGEVIVAINRIPAFIIGDEESTIEKLIEAENKNPLRGEGYNKSLAYIKIDDELISFIKKSSFTLLSIPKKGEKVQLRGNSNIGTGGITKDVTDMLSEDIKETCIQAAQLFGLEICGVDILTSDITKSLEDSHGVILELNATPGLGYNIDGLNVAGNIIGKLFFND